MEPGKHIFGKAQKNVRKDFWKDVENGMKRISRIVAFALLITLISPLVMTEAMAGLVLPSALQAIQDEAFCGDSGLESVVIPDGTVSIGSRAFADSSLTDIYLPVSLTDIAADAFQNSPDTVFHVDYFDEAYAYAVERNIPCDVSSAVHYAFEDAGVDNQVLTLQVTAQEACLLWYEILDEGNGESLYTGETGIEAGMKSGQVEIALPEYVPVYFELRAQMKTGDGHNLTDVYHTVRTTSRFAGFSRQTAEDFPDHVTMDLDDDGYAVLAAGARVTSGEDRQLAGNLYVISDSVAPSEGDVLLLDIDGEEVPVKVASVTANEDGTYTVVEVEDVTLADLYESYYISTEVGIGDKIPRSSIGLGSVEWNTTVGPVTLGLSGEAKLVIEFIYDAKWFGEDYYEFRAYVETDFQVKIDCVAAFDSEYDLDRDDGLNLVLYDEPIYGIKGIAGLNLKVAIPFAIRVESGFSVSGHYTSRFGVECISGERKAINTSEFEPVVEGHAGFEATVFGVKLELYAALPKDLLKAYVSGEVDVNVSGKLVDLQFSDMLDQNALIGLGKKIHACSLCVSGDVRLEGGIELGITWEISKHCHGDIVKGRVGWFDLKLFEFYISVLNAPESLFGGKLTWGKGKCPNCMYRTVVKTQDEQGNLVTGIPVKIIKADADGVRGESEMVAYLYPGDYQATASFGSGTCSESFRITTDGKEITLREGVNEIKGSVLDFHTDEPISGASVSVRNSEGVLIATAVTDAVGDYSLRVPDGTYVFIFSASGYTEKTISQTVSSDTWVDAELEGTYFTVNFYTQGGDDLSTVTAVKVRAGHTVPFMPSTAKDGYTLAGWNTQPDGSGGWFTSETVVTEDWVVYAIWGKYRFYQGHSYWISNFSRNWSGAQSWCESEGGHLVTITSVGEQAFLEQYMSEAVGDRDLWIGIKAPWERWVTGEALTMTKWGTNEPDGWNGQANGVICNGVRSGTNSCGYYHMDVGQWDDVQGYNSYIFICEWDFIKMD